MVARYVACRLYRSDKGGRQSAGVVSPEDASSFSAVADSRDAVNILAFTKNADPFFTFAEHTALLRTVTLTSVATVSDAKDPGTLLTDANDTMIFGGMALDAPLILASAKDPRAVLADADDTMVFGGMALDAPLILTSAKDPGALRTSADDAVVLRAVALDATSDNACAEYCRRTRNRRITFYRWHTHLLAASVYVREPVARTLL
jgi:hypothetical protein